MLLGCGRHRLFPFLYYALIGSTLERRDKTTARVANNPTITFDQVTTSVRGHAVAHGVGQNATAVDNPHPKAMSRSKMSRAISPRRLARAAESNAQSQPPNKATNKAITNATWAG